MRFINTDLTCKLDALPWTGFHTRFVLSLGITWVLDAFEVVIVSAVLKPMEKALQFTTQQASLMVSGFLIGAILGSLIFGYLACISHPLSVNVEIDWRVSDKINYDPYVRWVELWQEE